MKDRPILSFSATNLLNWNDGRLVNLSAGQTAKCENLVKGQLYALLLYNSSQTDVDAAVTVVWSNDAPPSTVTVRGSSGDGGPATFVFVSGSDTGFVSISLSPKSAASITAFIVSISMPLNTNGLNSSELVSDGQFHPFDKYDRYYAGAYSGWRSVTVENEFNQFICLQMLESTATVIVVNLGSGLANGQVTMFGPTAEAAGTVTIDKVDLQSYEVNIQGNGATWVWMNGDSPQNSKNSQIALQELSLMELLLNISGISRISKMFGKNTLY